MVKKEIETNNPCLCKLCHQLKELQLSHAIPNSVFKAIKKKNSGKLILLSGNDNEIVYSSDSLAEYQLCSVCEKKLNENYEAYALTLLRSLDKSITKVRAIEGIYLSKINSKKLILFVLSVFWRAANSAHPAYQLAELSAQDNEYLRIAILNDLNVPASKFSVKLAKLIDKTPTNGFSDTNLRDVIAPPVLRTGYFYESGRRSYFFIFIGLYFEVVLPPGKSFKERQTKGVLLNNKTTLCIPNIDIFEIPEFVQLMGINQKKVVDGKSRVKKTKDSPS